MKGEEEVGKDVSNQTILFRKVTEVGKDARRIQNVSAGRG